MHHPHAQKIHPGYSEHPSTRIPAMLIGVTLRALAHARGRSLLEWDDNTDDQNTLYVCMVALLVCTAGLMSGLTLGLMSLDVVDMEVLKRSGTDKEKSYAARIVPIISNSHYLLVTLLLMNAAAMEALPIFLEKLANPFYAVLLSVTAVLFIGEIIPQAICSKYGLAIGANLAWLVRLLMMLTSPISWPLGKILDYVLGTTHHVVFARKQLKALVDLHGEEGGMGGKLSRDEIKIITGALDLTSKIAYRSMTPLNKVFMLSTTDVLDEPTLREVLESGHSRIPVYRDGDRSDIVGLILVKELLQYKMSAQVPVQMLKMRSLPRLAATTPMYDMLKLFQTGRSHMAVLTQPNPAALEYALTYDPSHKRHLTGGLSSAPSLSGALAYGSLQPDFPVPSSDLHLVPDPNLDPLPLPHSGYGSPAGKTGRRGGTSAAGRLVEDEGSDDERSELIAHGALDVPAAKPFAPLPAVAEVDESSLRASPAPVGSLMSSSAALGGSSVHSGTVGGSNHGGDGDSSASNSRHGNGNGNTASNNGSAGNSKSPPSSAFAAVQTLSDAANAASRSTSNSLSEASASPSKLQHANSSGLAGSFSKQADQVQRSGSNALPDGDNNKLPSDTNWLARPADERGPSFTGSFADLKHLRLAGKQGSGGGGGSGSSAALEGRQHGGPNAATISAKVGEPIGIITIEDVIEELIRSEIVDETDRFVDNERLIQVNQALLAQQLPDNLRKVLTGRTAALVTLNRASVAARRDAVSGGGADGSSTPLLMEEASV